MTKPILADYEREVFSGEICLCPGQENPKVPGTERLRFPKLDLYPNAKPKSVKPIRLVGERAAAEQEIVEELFVRGSIELCPASEWASNGVPMKEKGKLSIVLDYRQLNEAILPDAHPLPLVENMLENQSKQKIFTIVDLSKGFHQIRLQAEARAKTAMNWAGIRYQWRVMPMAIKNFLLFFNGSWTTFYSVRILRMYILMIWLLVPPVMLKRYPEPMAHGPEACELSHPLWPIARRPVSRHTRAEAVDTGCQRDIPVL